MALYWTPQFRYPHTSGTVLTLTRAMGYWSRPQRTVGGWREAAAGGANVATRTIRRDYLLDVVLRFNEAEQTSIETMLAWMQDNLATAFDFWPDVGVIGTFYQSYLRAPLQGTDFVPSRNSSFPSDLETTLTLRRSNGAQWALAWYPD